MATIRIIFLLGALLLVSGGCEGPVERPDDRTSREDAPAGDGTLGAPPGRGEKGEAFPGSAPSLDALGRHVLQALTAGDSASLERVRLTEQEHNRVIWPELPAARPEMNFPAGFAWENIQLRNRRELERLDRWFRERSLEFGSVRCEGLETFETFRVHTDCRTSFRDADGRWLEARLFKDIVERGRGFKIFRYYADAPRTPLAHPPGKDLSSARSGT